MKPFFVDLKKQFHENYKTIITLFFLAFIINIVLLCIVNIISHGTVMDVFFDSDSSRVLSDMTAYDSNHYRATVHPLFILSTQPFVFILSLVFNPVISAIIFQAIIGAFSVVLFYFFINSLKLSSKTRLKVTLCFILSFSQIVFNSVFETYIFAQTGLLIMWVVTPYLIDKKLDIIDYASLVFFGVISIGTTVTNIFQFIVVIFIVVGFNKVEKHKLLKLLALPFLALCICVFLSQVQNIIWPSAPEFFKSNINGFLLKQDSEEILYIEKELKAGNILSQIKASTVYQLSPFAVVNFPKFGFIKNLYIDISAVFVFLIFIFINIFLIMKNKSNLSKHKLYLSILACYIFNFILHIFYAPNASFLFTLHYNFLLAFIIIYIIKNLKISFINKSKAIFQSFKKIFFFSYLGLQSFGIILYIIDVVSLFGIKAPMPKTLLCLIAISGLVLLLVSLKQKENHNHFS